MIDQNRERINRLRQKIIKERKKIGWSQYKLARKSMIPPPTLCLIESVKGVRTPTLGIIYKIADGLDISIHDLLAEDEVDNKDFFVAKWSLIHHLNDEQQSLIMSIISEFHAKNEAIKNANR